MSGKTPGGQMAERTDGSWPECAHEGCNGVQLDASRMCLAHASDEEQEAALRVINESGVVDARGVPLSNALLQRVVAAAPRDESGKAVINASRFDRASFTDDAGFEGVTFTGDTWFSEATFGEAWFRRVTFTGVAWFDRATFTSHAWFEGASFTGEAIFEGATFTAAALFNEATFSSVGRFSHATFAQAGFGGATFGEAGFREASFTGNATFDGASFTGRAWFPGASFTGGLLSTISFRGVTFADEAWFAGASFIRHSVAFDGVTFSGNATFTGATFGRAWFRRATFTGDASFDGASFTGYARFDGATFTGDASFEGASFTGEAIFEGATFTGDAEFDGVAFRGPAEFRRTRFEQAREFGPLLAYRGLVLDEAEFAQAVHIEVSATGVCCRRARFPAGVQFRLRWARVALDDTDFPAPSLLGGTPLLASEALAAPEARIARAWRRLLGGEISEQPQLLSLRRANVAGLGLSNVVLAGCRFAGAHNLDMLRLEANVVFAAAPAPLGRLSWEGRQVIAEERALRADRARRWSWSAPSWPDWLGDTPEMLDAAQIAGLYRALRKGREDIRDEPGAADFYYGEMEMRRRARPTKSGSVGTLATSTSRGRVERAILTAYWLVSGYGLRAWRALACLAVVTALLATGFHLIGFTQPPRPVSYWTSLLYSFRATVSLTDSDVNLTAWGRLLQALLRITGPVLLGLALLALRGRVKR